MKANKRWGCSSTGRALFYIRTIKVWGSTPRISKKIFLYLLSSIYKKDIKYLFRKAIKKLGMQLNWQSTMHNAWLEARGSTPRISKKIFLFNLSFINREKIYNICYAKLGKGWGCSSTGRALIYGYSKSFFSNFSSMHDSKNKFFSLFFSQCKRDGTILICAMIINISIPKKVVRICTILRVSNRLVVNLVKSLLLTHVLGFFFLKNFLPCIFCETTSVQVD